MSLSELLISAVVFAMAATGSLRVWSLSTATVTRSQHEEQLLVRLDADLERSEARLARLGRSAAPLASCELALQWMAAELPPADPSLGRSLQRQGAAWLLRYAPGEAGHQRQRLLDPLTFGLCLAEPAGGGAP